MTIKSIFEEDNIHIRCRYGFKQHCKYIMHHTNVEFSCLTLTQIHEHHSKIYSSLHFICSCFRQVMTSRSSSLAVGRFLIFESVEDNDLIRTWLYISFKGCYIKDVQQSTRTQVQVRIQIEKWKTWTLTSIAISTESEWTVGINPKLTQVEACKSMLE